MANLNLQVGLRVLSGHVGTKDAAAATGSFREVRRAVVQGQRVGYEKAILDHGGAEAGHGESDREAELLAELRQIRERRGG